MDRQQQSEESPTSLLDEITLKVKDTLLASITSKETLVERNEFMALRCQTAQDSLPGKLRKEATLISYGFVSALPLYDFDFNQGNGPALFQRPKLADVRIQSFQELVENIHELGFACFIDRPGLAPCGKKDWNGKTIPEVELSDFGMSELLTDYFDSLDAPVSRRYAPKEVHWALYVLLPEQAQPKFSLFRYFSYNRYPVDRLLLMRLTAVGLSISGIVIMLITITNMMFQLERSVDTGTLEELVE